MSDVRNITPNQADVAIHQNGEFGPVSLDQIAKSLLKEGSNVSLTTNADGSVSINVASELGDAKDYADQRFDQLVGMAPEQLDTIQELAEQFQQDAAQDAAGFAAVNSTLSGKLDATSYTADDVAAKLLAKRSDPTLAASVAANGLMTAADKAALQTVSGTIGNKLDAASYTADDVADKLVEKRADPALAASNSANGLMSAADKVAVNAFSAFFNAFTDDSKRFVAAA